MNVYTLLVKYQNFILDFVSYLSILLYIIIALNMSLNAPEYLETLKSLTKIYVSLFLIYRFNPFRQTKFNDFDSKIAFNAGIFLFTTTTINEILIQYFEKIKNRF